MWQPYDNVPVVAPTRHAWPQATAPRPTDGYSSPLVRVLCWHGHATGTWWAMVPCRRSPHGARLIEAGTEEALAREIARAQAEGTG